ncbi:UTRA domain-containing protein [Micromonospora sp. NPDC050187]|uniref:UTRA domain-containing protein n=1 Tax=Micromonospora sp. NPDC050187 TaxID=3364277 RepID=UPI00378D8A2B
MPYVTTGAAEAWKAEAAAGGGVGSQQLLGAAEVVAPAEVATALGVEPGAMVVVRRRLMLLDDRPVELTDSGRPGRLGCRTDRRPGRMSGSGAGQVFVELVTSALRAATVHRSRC